MNKEVDKALEQFQKVLEKNGYNALITLSKEEEDGVDSCLSIVGDASDISATLAMQLDDPDNKDLLAFVSAALIAVLNKDKKKKKAFMLAMMMTQELGLNLD